MNRKIKGDYVNFNHEKFHNKLSFGLESLMKERVNYIESLLDFRLVKQSCDLKTTNVVLDCTKELEYIKNNEDIYKNFFIPENDYWNNRIIIKFQTVNKDYLTAVRNYHESLK